eukprot:jgi/Botrbrau1/2735/Bobra.0164s0015.1
MVWRGFRSCVKGPIIACGLHVTEGHRVWDIYRLFAEGMLQSGQAQEKQVNALRSLFHRQLQVPLAEGPSTLKAYQEWEQGLGPAGTELPEAVRVGYEQAQQDVAVRAPFEDAVAPGKPSDADKLATFLSYLKFEETQGSVPRVQCMYERAVAAFPLTHQLWLQYGRYAEAQIKSPSTILPIYSPRRAQLPLAWLCLGTATSKAEKCGKCRQNKQTASYQRALAAGLASPDDYLEVLLARLDALREEREPPRLEELRSTFGSGHTADGGILP